MNKQLGSRAPGCATAEAEACSAQDLWGIASLRCCCPAWTGKWSVRGGVTLRTSPGRPQGIRYMYVAIQDTSSRSCYHCASCLDNMRMVRRIAPRMSRRASGPPAVSTSLPKQWHMCRTRHCPRGLRNLVKQMPRLWYLFLRMRIGMWMGRIGFWGTFA